MVKTIVAFLLLLLFLIQYNRYWDTASLEWNGPVIGTLILAIVCCVLMRRVVRQIRRTSESVGLPPELPKTSFDILPWLFLVPWMIGLRFVGDLSEFDSWGLKPTWEFVWGESPWKLFLMFGLVVAIYLFKIKQRILELEHKVSRQ